VGVKFSGAKLIDADLDFARLHGVSLDGASLHGATLRNAELYGANLHNARLDGADLTCAELHGAILSGATMDGANLQSAALIGTSITSPISISSTQFLNTTLQARQIDVRGAVAADFRLMIVNIPDSDSLEKEFYKIRESFERASPEKGDKARMRLRRIDSIADDEHGPGCLSQQAFVTWLQLDPKSIARRVFENMCRNVGEKTDLRGIDQASSRGCVRDPFSEVGQHCEVSPEQAMEHMMRMVCTERWFARSVIRRSVELLRTPGFPAEDENQTAYPGLDKLIEAKAADEKGSCGALREELAKHRRRQQGL
jgi:hypothetical protein